MSPSRRVLYALALAGCLTSSPALTAAAAPNQLANPTVSPGVGSTTTTFNFGVSYASDKGFAAMSVVAIAAGRSIVLRLASGTATGGTYTGASTLPAGNWAVTFEAQATQGPNASLSGPTVRVAAPVSAPPPPPPAPASRPAAPTPTVLPLATPSVVITPAAQPVATATTRPSVGPSTPVTEATTVPSASFAVSEPPLRSSAYPILGAVGTGGAGTTKSSNDDGSILGWLVGIAAVGLLAGLGLVVARARRRRRARMESAPSVKVTVKRPSGPAAIAAGRTVPAHYVEDPILAAMGIGKAVAGKPVEAPLTRRVRSGPGERETADAFGRRKH